MTSLKRFPPSDPVSARRPGRFATLVSALYRHSAVRYLIAGGLSFLVDFGLLWLMKEALGWPLWIATAVAFLVSFAFNYLIQRIFSFEATNPHGAALLKYTLLVAFNTVATVVVVDLISQTPAGWAVGKVVATALTTVWNYFVYRYWIFRDRGAAE